MKQPRRKAAWLAAFLLAASLTTLPREGAAFPPYIDGDPSPPNEGEPDGPPPAPRYASKLPMRWALSIVVASGRVFVIGLTANNLPPRLLNPSGTVIQRAR
jgi:hypothetical protein